MNDIEAIRRELELFTGRLQQGGVQVAGRFALTFCRRYVPALLEEVVALRSRLAKAEGVLRAIDRSNFESPHIKGHILSMIRAYWREREQG